MYKQNASNTISYVFLFFFYCSSYYRLSDKVEHTHIPGLDNCSEEPRLVVGGEDLGEGWGEVRRITRVIYNKTKTGFNSLSTDNNYSKA